MLYDSIKKKYHEVDIGQSQDPTTEENEGSEELVNVLSKRILSTLNSIK